MTMTLADPNQAIHNVTAISTAIIRVVGLVLIIGVGVTGPA
jgi:hypothetical protein